MKRFKAFITSLGSKTLTVWLAGICVIYYLTVAVWSKEAFSQFVTGLSHNNLFRALYLLFLLNISVRTAMRLRDLWPAKFVFFLRLPLYGGMLILLFAFFMSLNVRKNMWILAGEGDALDIPWESAPLRVIGIRSALEKDTLKTDDSLIFSSEPSITLSDKNGVLTTLGAFPPRQVNSTYMHILNFGIGPGVELRDGNAVLVRSYVALRLTPFGNVDSFELPPSPYKFYLSILPSRVIKKGKETAREYNLQKPRYGVEIVKGDRMIAKGETDDTIAFDQQMSLRFYAPSDWVLLDAARDPFLPGFVAGLLLTGAGIVVFPASFIRRGNGRSQKTVS